VEHRHTSREATGKSLHCLLGQGDFGDEADASLAGGDNLSQRPQVNLGLAAAGNAEEEKNRCGQASLDVPGLLRLHR
jgi:hypothetical protein